LEKDKAAVAKDFHKDLASELWKENEEEEKVLHALLSSKVKRQDASTVVFLCIYGGSTFSDLLHRYAKGDNIFSDKSFGEKEEGGLK